MAATAFCQEKLGLVRAEEARAVPGTHSVPAVEKVFTILEVLARSNTGMTLRELAKTCDLPKSSVHGIVITLQRCGV